MTPSEITQAFQAILGDYADIELHESPGLVRITVTGRGGSRPFMRDVQTFARFIEEPGGRRGLRVRREVIGGTTVILTNEQREALWEAINNYADEAENSTSGVSRKKAVVQVDDVVRGLNPPPCPACVAAVNFATAFRIDVGLVEAFATYERAQHSEGCPIAKVTNG
jgi:hypothetical protein